MLKCHYWPTSLVRRHFLPFRKRNSPDLSIMKAVNRFVVTCRRTATKEFERSSKSGTRNFGASSIPGPSAATIMTIGNETIQLRLEDRTAWITLDRPPLNILDIPMMQGLDGARERALPKWYCVI